MVGKKDRYVHVFACIYGSLYHSILMDYLALTIGISIPSIRLFRPDWKWNLGKGEVPCDGAQLCGDPTISLLREQDLVLLYPKN
jgi:hypothetical protein